jgi:DNA-binding SARP family transcriptional activator
MEVRALGTLQVVDGSHLLGPDGLGGRKPKQVLAVLLAARGHPVTKERLVDALWGEQPPRHPIATLENHVWVLRRHLRPLADDVERIIVAEPGSYRLGTDRVDLDLDRFDDLVHRSEASTSRVARGELERALSLIRGELIEDELYAPWLEPLRRTYEGRVRDAQLRYGELSLDLDDPATALAQAEQVLDNDALDERAFRLEVQALARAGEHAKALRASRAFRERLASELGIEPSPQTSAVYDALQGRYRSHASDHGPSVNGAELVTGRRTDRRVGRSGGDLPSPYDDQGPIGRDGEIGALRAAVGRVAREGSGLVLVDGLADVGKTRVVREALARMPGVPAGWVTLDRRTRRFPVLALAAALARAIGGTVPTRATTDAAVLGEIAEALARHTLVVVVLDDLHEDASGEVIEALGLLQLRRPDARVCLIGVYRRELVGYHHPLAEVHAAARVSVEPLAVEQLRPIGGRSALARTGGYGAYVDAWLRGDRHGVPEGDLLLRIESRCRTAGDLRHRLLRIASVLPEPFRPAALAAASGIDVRTVAEELDQLVSRGLLREAGTSGFAFGCSVVQDAVAAPVSAARRRVIRAAATAGISARASSPLP